MISSHELTIVLCVVAVSILMITSFALGVREGMIFERTRKK